jgi:hypothetical protein
VSRRLVMLLAVLLLAGSAAAALAAAGARTSRASYTTGSQTDVMASAATVAAWLSVNSQGGDSGVPSGYARQHNDVSQPFIASGQGASLAIRWGGYDDLNVWFTFSRVLTIRTPTAFPDPTVNQVTVTVSLLPDAGGTQMLRNPYLHLVNQAGTTSSVTLGRDQRAQLDIQLRTKKNPWDAGNTFSPHVVLTLTYAGGPAAYYVYDFETLLTVI